MFKMKPSDISEKAYGCLTMPDFWTTWSKTPLSDKSIDVLNDIYIYTRSQLLHSVHHIL